VESNRKPATSYILPVAFVIGLVLLLMLEAEPVQPVEPDPVRQWMRTGIGYMTVIAEIAAGVVITLGVLRAVYHYFLHFFHPTRSEVAFITETRLNLGRTLILGLELTVASDILRTVVAPTRADILGLGAIVLLRSLLNYVLEWEIEWDEARNRGSDDGKKDSDQT
jgi:uncharacterized membrane protein